MLEGLLAGLTVSWAAAPHELMLKHGVGCLVLGFQLSRLVRMARAKDSSVRTVRKEAKEA